MTSKALLDRAMALQAKLLEGQGNQFKLKYFFDELNRVSSVPIALGTWEMTGIKPEFLEHIEATARDQ